jgi:hypothetical protein
MNSGSPSSLGEPLFFGVVKKICAVRRASLPPFSDQGDESAVFSKK